MNKKTVSIGMKCPECDADQWYVIDEDNLYKCFCMNCNSYVYDIDKQDYVKKFECPDCGSLSGTLEENDVKLGVRCNNCGKLHIMLEKKGVCEDRRSTTPTPVSSNPEPKSNPNTPHCPTCGSTNIKKISATSKFMGAIGFGLFSKTARSQFECKNCGYKW